MRQELKTLSKFAFASAIAERQLDTQTDLATEDRALFEDLQKASKSAFFSWPLFSELTDKDIRKMQSALAAFLNRVQRDTRKIHIQTAINFTLGQMTDLLETTIADPGRRYIIESIAKVSSAIYTRYSSGKDREYPLCIQAGLNAGRMWDDVFNR